MVQQQHDEFFNFIFLPGSTLLVSLLDFVGSTSSSCLEGSSAVLIFSLTLTGKLIYGVLSSTLLFIPSTLS